MVRWHHRLDGHEFEQAPGVGDGQGSLDAKLDKAQAEIKRTGRNISNFRDSDDTILMAESEEEQKSLLMRVNRLT